jgi:hypothetical protein
MTTDLTAGVISLLYAAYALPPRKLNLFRNKQRARVGDSRIGMHAKTHPEQQMAKSISAFR